MLVLPVTVAEDPVSAAGAEPRAVLWRIFAERQSDWKRHRRFDFSGEGFLFLPFLHCFSNFMTLYRWSLALTAGE